MKLYYSKGACSLGIRILIHELGITSDYESVNLGTKQTEKGTDYLTVNPKGSVPALMLDDNQVLTENAVIQQYLADKNHAAHLLPEVGNIKRYQILEWLNYIATDLHKGFSPLFNQSVPQDLKDSIFIPALKKRINFVENNLQHKFLTGDTFTGADAYLFVILFWLGRFKISLSEWPRLEKYYNNVKNHPSVHQSLTEEGLLD